MMSTEKTHKKLEAIQDFSAAGYPLIPLNGKIPAIKNWENTAPLKYGADELGSRNYGVVLRDEDLVIDVDPRNFAPDDDPVARLRSDIGDPLTSFIVRTGGGGLHIYLKKLPGIPVVNSLINYPGIEFKALGRQVVGPGSIHPETNKEYEIVMGSLGDVRPAPESLLNLIHKKAETPKNGTNGHKDDAGTKERFISYLQSAEVSVEGKHGDLTAFRVGCQARDLGLSPETAFELLSEHWNPRCEPPWSAEDLHKKVLNAYHYAKFPAGNSHPEADFSSVPSTPKEAPPVEIPWKLNKQGRVIKCFHNTINYLRSPDHRLRGVFGYNNFTNASEIMNPAPWHGGRIPIHAGIMDKDLKMLKGFLSEEYGFESSVGTLEEAVTVVANGAQFHPVKEYLMGLKWDGVKRLDNWLRDYCGADDDEYTKACARKTLCAAVLRVFKPGCKFDHVLVLEGEQGIGKSGICKILGGDWAGDFTIDPHSKDSIQLMQGCWIMELAELEVTKRSEADALKAFLTRQVDEARMPYARLPVRFPRQSIFIASKNPGADGTYLNDDTGNRRWWPVALNPKNGQADFKGLKAARNQLFAEAVQLMSDSSTGGEKLYMDTDELRSFAKTVVSARHPEEVWSEIVSKWLSELPKSQDFVTAREIFVGALAGFDKQFDRMTALRVARAMKSSKWEKGFRWDKNRSIRCYNRP